MKIIYFGDHVSKNLSNQKFKNPAGNKWQKNLLTSLLNYGDVSIYSYFRPALYPKKKQIIVPNNLQINENENESKLLWFINIPVLRELCLFFSTIIQLIKINKEYKNIKILQYNIYSPVSLAIWILSYIYKYDYIPIILDIVLEESYKVNFFKKIYLKFELKFQKILFRNLKKVIVINKFIIKDFFKDIDFLLIEGGVSKEDIKFTSSTKKINENENKKIVFTGALDKVNGIDFLVRTLGKMKHEKLELIIFGLGELENFIIEEAKKDERIKYKGFKNNEDILTEQKKADFLIIPRKKTDLILRYTFPSKLFEYMLSKTPIICTNIPGLTKEYKDNLYIVDTEDEEEFSLEIKKILNKDKEELKEIGEKAREFIVKNKLWDLQAKKIIEFIK